MALHPHDTKVVTVFGGSGFLGRYLVKRLAKRGWRVRVATRDPGAAMPLRTMGTVGQITPVFAEIRDDGTVAAALRSADYAVNLVGILNESGRQTFGALHYEGARRVAWLAREAGVARLVHVSAIGADPASASEYARSKAAGEQAVQEAFPDATVLRPSVIFGPGDGFFTLFARLARLAPALPLFGGGRTRFQPVYAGDVAEAIVRALEDPAARARTFELGGPRVYTFKELLRLVLREVRRRRLLVPVPWPVASLQAAVLGLLPNPLLTRDQVAQLRVDNIADPDLPGLGDLGIEPTAVEVILPTYMDRFRVGGRFSKDRTSGLGGGDSAQAGLST